jgi:uncharacterized protein
LNGNRANGVRQDYTQAMKLYNLAASQGIPMAQRFIGVLYFDGNGVRQNYEKAIEWFRLAANKGDVGGAA